MRRNAKDASHNRKSWSAKLWHRFSDPPPDPASRTKWPHDHSGMWFLAHHDGMRGHWFDVPDFMGRKMKDIYEDGWREGQSPW